VANPYYNNTKVDGDIWAAADAEAIEDGFDVVNTEMTATEGATTTAQATADAAAAKADADTIVGIWTFDNGFKTDTISEATGAAGVTDDGLVIKDGGIAAFNTVYEAYDTAIVKSDEAETIAAAWTFRSAD
jgi:hypothetical protein